MTGGIGGGAYMAMGGMDQEEYIRKCWDWDWDWDNETGPPPNTKYHHYVSTASSFRRSIS